MKYIIISVTILFSVAWYWIQSHNSTHIQTTKVQIHGKVQGLQGTVVLNIEDKFLTLSPYDRFTFQLHTSSKEELNMQVIDQPKDQHCAIAKRKAAHDRMILRILCKGIPQPISNGSVVSL
ncbi:hypothetical protein [Psychromonas sp. Urea-02u-13]|uniref:hypothetical protein n=1 Tax=Psychromonas sp. Urea-02u-13 TaxID=2058326 RepID=UPI000C32766B|nr:hypothetical protein [Psychromonas sp. Urea-02u-13]PKG40114.1 hypothetical protein CXF74_04690 [Psychromonas sp. Urea-02u-13]